MTHVKNAFRLFLHEGEAINQEKTHQGILKVLLLDSAFAKLLLRATAEVGLVESEPQRGAFDLLVPLKDGTEYYLELKMWCELKEGQIKKQTQDLKDNQHAVYLLLGRSRYEWSKERVEQYPKAKRLSYEELLHALERYLELAASPELTELAGAYKVELEDQFSWLESAWKTVSRTDKNMALPYYYSAYAAIQKKLPPGIPTRIFTATNQGGGDYILQESELRVPAHFEADPIGELYLEIHNGAICIRLAFNPDSDKPRWAAAGDHFAAQFKQLLSPESNLRTEGRASKWMKIICMPLNFEEIDGIEPAAEIFKKWRQVLLAYSI